jgi:hypothetical protein
MQRNWRQLLVGFVLVGFVLALLQTKAASGSIIFFATASWLAAAPSLRAWQHSSQLCPVSSYDDSSCAHHDSAATEHFHSWQ